MRSLKIPLCGLLFLASAGISLGQERFATEVRPVGTVAIHRTSVVLGAPVVLAGGATYGKIVDFVISTDGCISYAVMGDQDNYVLVPWSYINVDYGQRMVQVNVTRDRLLPLQFARDRWPDLSDYGRRVRTVFTARTGDFERRGERYAVPPGQMEIPRDVDRDRLERRNYDRDRDYNRLPADRLPPDVDRSRDRLPSDQVPPPRVNRPEDRRPPEQVKPPENRPADNRPPDNRPPDNRPPTR
jgi:PRC-barrel domain